MSKRTVMEALKAKVDEQEAIDDKQRVVAIMTAFAGQATQNGLDQMCSLKMFEIYSMFIQKDDAAGLLSMIRLIESKPGSESMETKGQVRIFDLLMMKIHKEWKFDKDKEVATKIEGGREIGIREVDNVYQLVEDPEIASSDWRELVAIRTTQVQFSTEELP